MSWAPTRARLGEEDGQTLILGIGLIAVVAALVLVIASATAVYLDLKTLTSLADSAAAASADAVSDSSYYAGSSSGSVPGLLTDDGVRAAAAADVAGQSSRLTGTRIVAAKAQGGMTAVVTLTAHSKPPFLPWGVIPSEGFTLTATGSARTTTTTAQP